MTAEVDMTDRCQIREAESLLRKHSAYLMQHGHPVETGHKGSAICECETARALRVALSEEVGQ